MDDAAKGRLRLARPVARQGQSWYRIQGKADEVADVYIYDEISWWGISAQDFVNELREVTAPKVNLHLNSPGGDVFDAHAIYQALLDHPAEVTTLVDSLAASAASVIAMAGERIVMGKAAMLMIHDAWGLAIGNAADMRDMADRLDKISNVIAGVYAERAGGPLEFWRQAMLEESWYDAEEAVAAGLADEVRQRKAAADAPDDGDGAGQGPEDRWDLSIFKYQGRKAAPAPVLRPAAKAPAPAPDPVAPAEPAPAADAVLAGVPDEVLAQLGDILNEVIDPFGGYDPDAVRIAITDRAKNAPATPAIQPRDMSKLPDHVSLKDFGAALWEALQ